MDLTLLTNMCQFFRPKTITRKEVTPPFVLFFLFFFFFFFCSKYLIADWREREREVSTMNMNPMNKPIFPNKSNTMNKPTNSNPKKITQTLNQEQTNFPQQTKPKIIKHNVQTNFPHKIKPTIFQPHNLNFHTTSSHRLALS